VSGGDAKEGIDTRQPLELLGRQVDVDEVAQRALTGPALGHGEPPDRELSAR
jgi:hypothetical protein